LARTSQEGMRLLSASLLTIFTCHLSTDGTCQCANPGVHTRYGCYHVSSLDRALERVAANIPAVSWQQDLRLRIPCAIAVGFVERLSDFPLSFACRSRTKDSTQRPDPQMRITFGTLSRIIFRNLSNTPKARRRAGNRSNVVLPAFSYFH
jgi:hypothetical protein